MSDQPSTKPYLIRAIHEWCADNGYRPYIAVAVDETTVVPMEFVRSGEIVLNVSAEATHHLVIGNQRIEFEARFNRVARQVSVPVANVTAIYAAENGHGMAFDVPKPLGQPRSAATHAPEHAAADGPLSLGASDAQAAALDDASGPGARSADAPASGSASADAPSGVRRRGRARKADAPASPMALVPLPPATRPSQPASPAAGPGEPPEPVPPPAGGRPRLTRVK